MRCDKYKNRKPAPAAWQNARRESEWEPWTRAKRNCGNHFGIHVTCQLHSQRKSNRFFYGLIDNFYVRYEIVEAQRSMWPIFIISIRVILDVFRCAGKKVAPTTDTTHISTINGTFWFVDNRMSKQRPRSHSIIFIYLRRQCCFGVRTNATFYFFSLLVCLIYLGRLVLAAGVSFIYNFGRHNETTVYQFISRLSFGRLFMSMIPQSESESESEKVIKRSPTCNRWTWTRFTIRNGN